MDRNTSAPSIDNFNFGDNWSDDFGLLEDKDNSVVDSIVHDLVSLVTIMISKDDKNIVSMLDDGNDDQSIASMPNDGEPMPSSSKKITGPTYNS